MNTWTIITEPKCRVGNSIYQTSKSRRSRRISGQKDLNRLINEIIFFNARTLFYSVPAVSKLISNFSFFEDTGRRPWVFSKTKLNNYFHRRNTYIYTHRNARNNAVVAQVVKHPYKACIMNCIQF